MIMVHESCWSCHPAFLALRAVKIHSRGRVSAKNDGISRVLACLQMFLILLIFANHDIEYIYTHSQVHQHLSTFECE